MHIIQIISIFQVHYIIFEVHRQQHSCEKLNAYNMKILKLTSKANTLKLILFYELT